MIRAFQMSLGTLRKLDGNATTAAINTMKFIILNKRDE